MLNRSLWVLHFKWLQKGTSRWDNLSSSWLFRHFKLVTHHHCDTILRVGEGKCWDVSHDGILINHTNNKWFVHFPHMTLALETLSSCLDNFYPHTFSSQWPLIGFRVLYFCFSPSPQLSCKFNSKSWFVRSFSLTGCQHFSSFYWKAKVHHNKGYKT